VPSRTPDGLAPSATAGLPTATTVPPTPFLAGPYDPTIPLRQRFGVAGAIADVWPAYNDGLVFGSHHNFRITATPPNAGNLTFWQTVRLTQDGLGESWETLGNAVRARPGSIWVIANEPDVPWQDNVTPERYAELYHDAYTFIEEIDPTARFAAGNISQSTPLRRAYLDRVLSTYQSSYGVPLPADIWAVHGYILNEDAASWGVGIPPSMSDELARHYQIPDHGDMAIFRQNLVDFRSWMAERGYQNRPLAVTEFGILFPNDYGYPPETVAAFLTSAFDFFLSAADESGYPPDGNRLVQWWFWYSLHDDEAYPTGNLYDRQTHELTPLGLAFADYAGRYR
jgi:hypothetical protein